MEAFFDYISRFGHLLLSIIRQFEFKDAVDIFIVSILIYGMIMLIRQTRAGQLVKGILVLVVAYALSSIFEFLMLNSIMTYFFQQFAIISILVVFQPEIRKALEQVGRSQVGKSIVNVVGGKDRDGANAQLRVAISNVADACNLLQQMRMGALVIFEKTTKLGEVVETGTVLDADPSAQLISNVFFNKAPLHDGAMVISAGRISAAGCILPLTSNDSIGSHLGTRHRAALGISEVSDAVAVVVSEETGQLSIAYNGELTRNYNRVSLSETLVNILIEDSNDSKKGRSSLLGRFGFKFPKK